MSVARPFFATILLGGVAWAMVPGVDDFEDLSVGSVSAPVVRSYGQVVSEAGPWSGPGFGHMEVWDDPHLNSRAVNTYGDRLGVDYDNPVSSLDMSLLICGCQGSGYYSEETGAWMTGTDAVELEVRDVNNVTVDYQIYPWVYDPTTPPGCGSIGRIDLDYTSAANDIGGFRINWGNPCYLVLDDLSYSDAPALQPEVTVTGDCAGVVNFDFSGFTPNGQIQMASASGAGNFAIGSPHPCEGTNTGLAANARLRLDLTADAMGSASISRRFRNNNACVQTMRALDVATCTLNDSVFDLP